MTSQSRETIQSCEKEIRAYILEKGGAFDVKLMELAFKDLARMFKGKWRHSGEPMITHSLRVARLLCRSNEDPQTVIAGLLHDIIEDTSMTYEDVKAEYGKWYADMVESLSKTSNLEATHEKLVQAGQKDVRALIIKTFDRLDNMRELEWLPSPKQDRISQETMSFYIPIARNIGVASHVTNELRQLSIDFQV